ncbi:IclR family transcriptional regulator [Flexivirga sp. ID2601S]|uniref:IclR family transcriptional regulator n=1 Tax=Flexivirga aerilata TaxID=1656889 RepID=A0A849ANJ1_9MICO|nr:IclR family transcriptional regulator [Flexivirga aerilata]NNG40878.1 IclR family transcriptional regulator [Flexivirga aerilata]
MPQTVDRAIEVIELCSQRPRTILELAQALDVHRTTALRLVNSLMDAGFLRRDDAGLLGVGFRLAGLAHAALAQFDLRSLVHGHIVELSETVGHTIQFAVPQGDRLIYVDKVEPDNSITLNTHIGGDVVVNTAGVSKAILANLPPDRRDAVLRSASWTRYTDATITSPEEMLRRLDDVRRKGWATDEGEFETYSNCVAAPVWNHAGQVAGAISITAFRQKADIEQLTALVPTLIEATTAISHELGWTGPPRCE